MKLAAIDIGSNAARLLINDVTKDDDGNPEFIKINLLRIPLRLGIDVFQEGEIGSVREKMFIDSMSIFQQLMDLYKIDHYRACATSAMREAKNGSQIIKEIKKRFGLNIEIISGDEEATLIYENHVADVMDNNFGYLYIDVGGGSTELTFYENKKLKYKKSFNVGTIRILNNQVTNENWDEIKKTVKEKVSGSKSVVAIGSGGNINKIFSMSKTKDGKPIPLRALKTFYKEASALSIKERMNKYKIREDRADVLVPAMEVFTKIMSWAKIKKIYVPKISVADGLIHDLYEKNKD